MLIKKSDVEIAMSYKITDKASSYDKITRFLKGNIVLV